MKCNKCGKLMKYIKVIKFNDYPIEGWKCSCSNVYYDPEQANRVLILNKAKIKGHKKILHNTHRCKYCREWYQDVLKETKKVKNKYERDRLLNLWKTLWLNKCSCFDIICYEWADYYKIRNAKEVKFEIEKKGK
ncbi:hypothetical protein HYX07_02190 [Candidatus Woesearchaeota archaeon]|nr:hypothetical protein [Candidatus Woesearchaeota archaeon]